MTSLNEKALILYFTSTDVLFKMSNEEIGDLVRKEMMWLQGETDEPDFDNNVLQFCYHSRIKEQRAIADYRRQKTRECRERKKETEAQEQPTRNNGEYQISQEELKRREEYANNRRIKK